MRSTRSPSRPLDFSPATACPASLSAPASRVHLPARFIGDSFSCSFYASHIPFLYALYFISFYHSIFIVFISINCWQILIFYFPIFPFCCMHFYFIFMIVLLRRAHIFISLFYRSVFSRVVDVRFSGAETHSTRHRGCSTQRWRKWRDEIKLRQIE